MWESHVPNLNLHFRQTDRLPCNKLPCFKVLSLKLLIDEGIFNKATLLIFRFIWLVVTTFCIFWPLLESAKRCELRTELSYHRAVEIAVSYRLDIGHWPTEIGICLKHILKFCESFRQFCNKLNKSHKYTWHFKNIFIKVYELCLFEVLRNQFIFSLGM